MHFKFASAFNLKPSPYYLLILVMAQMEGPDRNPVFRTNYDQSTVVPLVFRRAARAKFIRITVLQYNSHPSIRFACVGQEAPEPDNKCGAC
jgi:hypothetical protein